MKGLKQAIRLLEDSDELGFYDVERLLEWLYAIEEKLKEVLG